MNWNTLLTAHNIFVALAMALLGAGWLLGKVDGAVALPLLLTMGGIGVGASVTVNGIQTGVPLNAAPTQTKGPTG